MGVRVLFCYFCLYFLEERYYEANENAQFEQRDGISVVYRSSVRHTSSSRNVCIPKCIGAIRYTTAYAFREIHNKRINELKTSTTFHHNFI